MSPIAGSPIKPLLTFKEYFQRVVGDPRRIDEMKVLVDLFGMPYLEKVMTGEAVINPEDFLGTTTKSN